MDDMTRQELMTKAKNVGAEVKNTDTKEDLIEKIEDAEIALENLPIHVLRDKLVEKEIPHKPSHSKDQLIKALVLGESIIPKREIKRFPVLGSKKRHKIVAVVPEKVKEAAEEKNVKYTVDEETCSITFHGRIEACVNLDSPVNVIMNALRSTRGGPQSSEFAHGEQPADPMFR